MTRQTRTKLLILTSLVVCISLSFVALAHADVVSDWNAIATQMAVPGMVSSRLTIPATNSRSSLLSFVTSSIDFRLALACASLLVAEIYRVLVPFNSTGFPLEKLGQAGLYVVRQPTDNEH